jgi:hypothetical protein
MNHIQIVLLHEEYSKVSSSGMGHWLGSLLFQPLEVLGGLVIYDFTPNNF